MKSNQVKKLLNLIADVTASQEGSQERQMAIIRLVQYVEKLASRAK